MVQCIKCFSLLHCHCLQIDPEKKPINFQCPRCLNVRNVNGRNNIDFPLLQDFNEKNNNNNNNNNNNIDDLRNTNGIVNGSNHNIQ